MSDAFDISIITSLYRAERFLPEFFGHVQTVAEQVGGAGRSLELVVVANDATTAERRSIDAFAASSRYLTVVTLYTERESLYASWNRGVRAARGRAVGFWNADDIRTAEGLLEGAALVEAGAEIIYFPLIQDVQQVWYGIPDRRYQKHVETPPYDRERFRHEPLGGTFFMLTPSIFERVGGFDARFRVMGDFDWWIRATDHADFTRAESMAGWWIKHGENLTSGGRGELEQEVIRLRYGQYDRLRYGLWDPRALRDLWAEWEADSPTVPPDVAERLWGERAIAAWDAGAGRRRLQRAVDPLKAALRLTINHTRTRRYFYRLGLVKDRLP